MAASNPLFANRSEGLAPLCNAHPKEWARQDSNLHQTVMSGGISISFVDLIAVLFDFDRVRYASIRLFLVRNWCGKVTP